jgi:hypothetical protein
VEPKLGCLFAALFSASVFCQDVRVDRLKAAKRPIAAVSPSGGQPAAVEGRRWTISITPETAVDRWADEYQGGRPFQTDSAGIEDLSDAPATLVVPVNDHLRIDGPATYTLRITTRPVGAPTAYCALFHQIR